jgi:photosystem II stability/assembly factor-like uncharacterized protein
VLVRVAVGVLVGILIDVASVPDTDAGVGVWTSGGPEGGPVIALAVDPLTPSVVYAGAQFGGVFKSSTGGAFWTPINVGLSSPQIHALAVDPKTSGVVYAGTALGGVFKTTNGGASWSARNAGLPFPGQTDAVLALAIDPKTPTTLYAGTLTGGIFKSTNGGASWSQSFSAGAAVNVLAIDPLTPTTLYAGTITAGTPGRGVYKTTNGGASWIQSISGLGSLQVYALAVDPTTPAIVYAATFGGGLFRSSNAGASWSASNQGGLTDPFLLAVTVDPKSPTTVYVGTLNSGIFKSTNGGASWSPSNAGLPSAATITALAIDPLTPLTLYAGLNGDGVFNTVNGGAGWSSKNASLAAALVLALAADRQTGTLYAGTLREGVFKSSNGGASWGASTGGITDPTVNVLAVNPLTATTLFAGTSQSSLFISGGSNPGTGGIFRSTNGGATWSRSLFTDRPVQALAINPQTPSTVYAGLARFPFVALGDGVLKSSDNGVTWGQFSAGLPVGTNVYALAIDQRPPFTLYAGTGAGRVYKRIDDGGAGWVDTGFLSPYRVVALALDPQASATLYVATQGDGVFKSTNGGSTWSPINTGLGDRGSSTTTIFALAIDPQNPATVYAGSLDGGVFKTTNGGASWSSDNPGLPADALVLALALNDAGTCLHAGTGGSVFDFASRIDSGCPSPPSLVSAILPSSRSVQVGTRATAFATIINTGTAGSNLLGTNALTPTNVAGVTCGITQLTGVPTRFTFQATDPRTNEQIAPLNTPVEILPGKSAAFVISLTPTAAFCSTDIKFGFNCTNSQLALLTNGVNDLTLTTSINAVPDMIALAATLRTDGIVHVTRSTNTGVFAVATTNLGASGTITVSADTGNATLPVNLAICQTNPMSGVCLSPPSPTVTTQINTNETPTFAVFVSGSDPVPFDPATKRIFVRFKENATCETVSGMVTRGATSVAVTTE